MSKLGVNINVTFFGRESLTMNLLSLGSTIVSRKPNQYITNPGPNLKNKLTILYINIFEIVIHLFQ